MVKRYLFLFMFLLTLSGCEGILDSYDEHFGPTVNLWGEEYSVKNTIELDLSNSMLVGEFPLKVLKLINLKILDLSFNQLSGEIPNEIKKFHSIFFLRINHPCTIYKISVCFFYNSTYRRPSHGRPSSLISSLTCVPTQKPRHLPTNLPT